MNIRPIGDRVLIRPIVVKGATKSGVLLPETDELEKKAEGEIIMIGTGKKITKLDLFVGQKVLYRKWSGEEIEVDKEKYKILDHTDLVAIIE